MYTLQNTLYVMTPNAYAHLENATVRIDVEHEKKLQVPLHHLGGLVCFGNVMVSPALMHRLADEGKSLVLLDSTGRFKARLEGPVSGNILLRQAQHQKSSDMLFTLEIARAIVAGKLRNSRSVILRGARESVDADETKTLARTADDLAASLRATKEASDLDTLRGIEGEAARGYFGALNLVVKPAMREDFRLNGRTRRPPLDRFNALLSFLYAMLMNDCRSALEAVGLDPQLGFLHAVRPGRAALALDLQEEFRSILADRLALTLINRGQVSADDFDEREGGAVMLNETGRRVVVTAWQERKQEEVTHPLTEAKIPLALLPFLQARFIAPPCAVKWKDICLSSPNEGARDMLIIVTYDVSTETSVGRRRLRRVAKTCESMGQRVQKSVFECQVNEIQYERLVRELLAEIDAQEDSLRFYRITEPSEVRVKQYGKTRSIDFEGPLVV